MSGGNILLIIAFILTGFTATITQALLIRELVIVFSGNELSLGIIFANWLFWVALGSFSLGKLVTRFKNKTIKLYINFQILLSLFLLPTFLGIKIIRVLWDIHPGELIGLFPFFVSTFIFLAPAGMILGIQFALACRIYARRNIQEENQKAVSLAGGQVYILDAFGNMLGGAIFTYLLVSTFFSLQTLSFLVLLNLSLALVLSLFLLKKKRVLVFCLLGLFVFVSTPARLSALNRYIDRWQWKGMAVVTTHFSKFADYAVLAEEGGFVIYGNGQMLFSLPQKSLSEEIAHLSLTQVKDPRRVLLIGGGAGETLSEILKYPTIKEVFFVERDPKLINLAQKYITKEDKKALINCRTRMIFGDGRLFVKTYQGDKFDAVILNVGNPLTAQLNRYYTLEFFKEVKSILSLDGIFFLGIDSHENYLSPEMRKFNGCIYSTLKTVFPYIVFFPGGTLYFAASPGDNFLSREPEELGRRLKQYGLNPQYINQFTLPDRLNPERQEYLQNILSSEEKESRRSNLDFHPISYYYNILLWGSKSFPSGLARFFWRFSRVKFFWLILAVVFMGGVLTVWRKKTEKNFIPLAVSIGGLVGMSLELILINGFQIIYGELYFMIGLIVACFMLGLILGAGFVVRKIERFNRPKRKKVLSRIEFGLGAYAFFIGAGLLFLDYWSKTSYFLATQVLFPFLTIICGFWVGMIFPLANSLYAEKGQFAGATAARLYGADLLGACLGALITAAFLIPLFGLVQTAFLVGLVCFLGSFLLVLIKK